MPVKQSYPRRPRALVGMNISRRDFLKMGMEGAAVLFLPFGASGCGGLTAGNNSTQGSAGTLLKSAAKLPGPFRVPLPIPPVLEPIRTDATTDYYRITQKISQAIARYPTTAATAVPTARFSMSALVPKMAARSS